MINQRSDSEQNRVNLITVANMGVWLGVLDEFWYFFLLFYFLYIVYIMEF